MGLAAIHFLGWNLVRLGKELCDVIACNCWRLNLIHWKVASIPSIPVSYFAAQCHAQISYKKQDSKVFTLETAYSLHSCRRCNITETGKLNLHCKDSHQVTWEAWCRGWVCAQGPVVLSLVHFLTSCLRLRSLWADSQPWCIVLKLLTQIKPRVFGLKENISTTDACLSLFCFWQSDFVSLQLLVITN